ncbi:acetyltransferase [Bacillus safensis FO-36b]|uniref:GNAT family N-acetyltransferase n=1 Tax=Bacillus TaxID=1386 RepID=UPI00045D32B2|nr:GNAT family N-acetyltransferase [Bacillus safensis]AWI35382.1 GNAT family acetyltransferase [Bacillus safensis FO-36b]KDE26387.1 acetyltransferase [Bacillus safensis FO-36b]MCM3050057.1 GNAT family N-acetyltransferase [Bacillus safensis]MEC1047649.1 GNAT family N-acetyltransferase [Bacillus safensis]
MKPEQLMAIRQLEEKIHLFSSAVNGTFLASDDFVLSNTQISTDTFNLLLPTSAQIQDPKKVKAAIEHMRSQKLIFSTWVDHRLLHPDWADLLKEYHLQEVERNTIMMLEHTGDIDPVTSSSLTIKEVLDEQTLFDYKHIFIELFKGSTEAAALEDYFQHFSIKKLHSKARMFVGYEHHKPVTTGLLFETNDSYGIYDVITKAEHRGKGLGNDMFHYLLTKTENKQKCAILQASADGKNIYQRAGFQPIGEMAVFE